MSFECFRHVATHDLIFARVEVVDSIYIMDGHLNRKRTEYASWKINYRSRKSTERRSRTWRGVRIYRIKTISIDGKFTTTSTNKNNSKIVEPRSGAPPPLGNLSANFRAEFGQNAGKFWAKIAVFDTRFFYKKVICAPSHFFYKKESGL